MMRRDGFFYFFVVILLLVLAGCSGNSLQWIEEEFFPPDPLSIEPEEVAVTCDVDQLISEIESAGPNGKIINLDSCTYIFNVSDNSILDENDLPMGSNALPSIVVPITLNGQNGTTFQRNQRTATEHFRFLHVTGAGKLGIKNIIFKYGDVSGNDNTGGGAIFNQGGKVTINNAVFELNAGHRGGAVMNSGGALQIFGSELRENSAVEGGAVANKMLGELKSSGNTYINNYAGDMGGALSNHSGVITLLGDQFSNNSSENTGGAVSSTEDLSTVDIQDSIFSNNVVGSDNMLGTGGAVAFTGGSNIIENCEFQGNLAAAPSNGNSAGGALFIYESSSTTIMDSKLLQNTAHGGGGIFTGNSNVVISNSEISENEAYDGGGIGQDGTLSQLTINSTTIDHNLSQNEGGGIYIRGDPEVVMTNSTMSGNQANDGSAISGNFRLSNCTIAHNTANYPAGWGITGGGKVKNSLFIENRSSDGNLRTCNFSSIQLSGDNLSDDDAHCTGFIFTDNAGLSPLAYNGGNTKTHSLSNSSDAVDVVIDCTTVRNVALDVDQREVARPQGSRCDCGAFELEQILPLQPDRPYVEINRNANCREKPGGEYPIIGYVEQGVAAEVVGRDPNNIWYMVKEPDYGKICWIWKESGTFYGDLDLVEVIIPLLPEEEKPEEKVEEPEPEEDPTPCEPGAPCG